MSRLKTILHIKNEPVRIILAECVATFILVTFAIASGAQYVLSNKVMNNYLSVTLASGVGLTLGIYFAGEVSGGHVNPAITLAFCLDGRTKWSRYPFYVIGQFIGSFLAAACQYGVYYDAINHYDGGVRKTVGNGSTAGIFVTFPQEFVSTSNAFFDQVFSCTILISSVLAISDKRNMLPSKGLLPIAMGILFFGIGACFGFNCNYPVNPARDLAPRIFIIIAGWGIEPFSYRNYNWFWVPVAGPLTGGILAWIVYSSLISLHWPEIVDDSEPDGRTISCHSLKTTVKTVAATCQANKKPMDLRAQSHL